MNDALKYEAERIAEFVQEHYPPAMTWEDPVGYCAWFLSHGFMTRLEDADKNVVAVGAGRPVDRPGMGVLDGYFNEGGTCLHIDLLIDKTDDRRGTHIIRQICKMRFPQCTTVTMFRGFEQKMHVYPLDKLFRRGELIKRKAKQHETVNK